MDVGRAALITAGAAAATCAVDRALKVAVEHTLDEGEHTRGPLGIHLVRRTNDRGIGGSSQDSHPNGLLMAAILGWLDRLRQRTRRDAEEVRRAAARFHRLTDSGVFGVAMGSLDGRFTYANDAFLKLTGSAIRDDVKAAGYFVFSPALGPEGRQLVVNRGYEPARAYKAASGVNEIVGAVRFPEQQ